MSQFEQRLREELTELHAEERPPEGWKARVWQAALREPVAEPTRRRRWWLAPGLAGAVVAAAALVLVVASWARDARESYLERERQLNAEIAEFDARINRELERIEQVQASRDAMYRELLAAKTEEERAAAARRIESREQELVAAKSRIDRLRKARNSASSKQEDCDPQDAQCGIDGTSEEVLDCDPEDPLCRGGNGFPRSIRKSARPKKKKTRTEVNCDPNDPLCGS